MAKIQANYDGLDLGKIVMAILVVSIHTQPVIDCSNRIINVIWSNVSSLAVPFFFVTTSWLFFVRRDDIYSEKNRKDLYKRICHFIRLYILWEAIYLPCVLTGYYRNGQGLFFNTIDYIRKFVFVGSNYYTSQFWFLLSMIYLLIMLYFFLKWKFSLNKILIIACLFYAIGTIINHLIIIQPDDAIGLLWLLIRYFSSLCNKSIVLSQFIYIVVGMVIAKRHILLSKCKIMLLLVISVLGRIIFARWYMLENIAMLFEVIAVFQIFLQLRLANHSIAVKLRESSIVLYYSHFYFIFLYELIFNDFSQSGLKLFEFCLLCCLLLSLLVIRLKQYQSFRWLRTLFD